MNELRLYLLGPFRAMVAGQAVQGFAYEKVRALLAYLAVEHQTPHARETLATLLWPDADNDTARSNLRKALSTLRKAICCDAQSPYLIIQRETVQFNPDSNFWLDVDQLKRRLDATAQHPHLTVDACQICLHNLEEAVALYGGTFLQGLRVDSLEYEEWLLTIQENLHTRILSALHELAQNYLRQGAYTLAQKHALRQVQMEPYREEAHRTLMQSLTRSGQRSAALGQFERCRRILSKELGVEPSAETLLLYQQIRSSGEAWPHNLPTRLYPLVGRDAELHEIGERLANPDCRLLTLAGMGGIGKTSLALQVAWDQRGNFMHGTFWVPLATLRSADQIPTAIVDALPITLSSEPETQLSNYLREKTILLVLDNFEHLISTGRAEKSIATNLLNKILKDAPQVKLLITSRERLRLRMEWVLPVEGLPYPASWTGLSAADLLKYAALQLFAQRARQFAPNFLDEAGVYSQIARICKLVNGIPLGIELASGWVDQLTCQAIADGIEADLDFLVTTLRDMPDRHQSLRAVFDHSWKLLSNTEQSVLRKLSVFQTAFNHLAAREVSQAVSHQLATLVNKSFVKVDAAGQYSMHRLLKQFLEQALAAEPHEERSARHAHAAYCVRFLKEREFALTVQFQAATLAEIEDKIADLRAAWNWAVVQQDWSVIDGALEGLFIYYWARNQFALGQALLAQVVERFRTQNEPAQTLLRVRISNRIADFSFWLGDLTASEKILQESIPILQNFTAQDELCYVLELLSRIYYWQGENRKSKDYATQSIAIARISGTQHYLAQALSSLATTICEESADYQSAAELYAESLTIYRLLENPFGIAKVLLNQGAIRYEQGDFSQAQQLYQESLHIYREVDYAYGISACLNNLALIARKLNDCEQAKVLIAESLALKRETGNRVAILHSLFEIGVLNLATGNYPEARHYLCESLRMALDTEATGLIANILLGFSELYCKTGANRQAAVLTAWVLSQAQIGQDTHEQAQQLWAELERTLTLPALKQDQQRAASLDLDRLVKEFTCEQ